MRVPLSTFRASAEARVRKGCSLGALSATPGSGIPSQSVVPRPTAAGATRTEQSGRIDREPGKVSLRIPGHGPGRNGRSPDRAR